MVPGWILTVSSTMATMGATVVTVRTRPIRTRITLWGLEKKVLARFSAAAATAGADLEGRVEVHKISPFLPAGQGRGALGYGARRRIQGHLYQSGGSKRRSRVPRAAATGQPAV